VDGFLNDPDRIREYGLSLPMNNDQGTSMSGFRSDRLLGLNPTLTKSITQKVLACYFDSPVSYNRVHMLFNKVPNISTQEDSYQNQGWTHHDGNADYSKLAGVIYLTPNCRLDAGTSLFKLKKGEQYYKPGEGLNSEYEEIRNKYYRGDYPPEMERKHRAWNNKFEETARFQNVYNRMVCYDGREFHRANNFFNDGEPRLTLVFFISGIRCDTLPLRKLKLLNEGT
tara:strand:+ start:1165 stop:1842 length:678 start_codon:yes stop_codon:yes gene_type:complete